MGGIAVLVLTACASSVPSNFIYETSLRGEQGFIGRSEKISAAETLLDGGRVSDPAPELRAALPGATVKLRNWGVRYFEKNWNRYQVVLNADISETGQRKVKCRLVSPEKLTDAPTLRELRANDGAEVQRRLEALVKACAAQHKQANTTT